MNLCNLRDMIEDENYKAIPRTTTLNLYQVQVYHKGERDSPFLPELS